MAMIRSPRRSGLLGSLLPPLAGGLLLAAAFPPLRIWPLAFVAYGPLWWRMAEDLATPELTRRGRRAFMQGWAMGLSSFVGILAWLLALPNEEVTIPGLMIPSLIFISLYLGIFFGLAALISSFLARRMRLPLLLVAPVVTTLMEYLRSLGPLGFPWGVAAGALARQTTLIQIASQAGFWGLLLFVLVVTALVTVGVRGWRWGFVLGALLVLALGMQGVLLLKGAPDRPMDAPYRVLVAQPDIRREIKWRPEKRDEVIAAVMGHGEEAVASALTKGGFDLFVWPETVLPVRLLSEPPVRRVVENFADRLPGPLLVGTQEGYWSPNLEKPEWVCHNSALLVFKGGRHSPVYRKLQLVPFSERMPLKEVAPWLGNFDFGQSNFTPGEEPLLLENGEARIGCLICFDSIFPAVGREMVRRGANLLVVITNDFWFGATAGPAQHAELAIFRAVENRTPLIRCANTGISFAVDAYGRVSAETAIFTQVDFVQDVALGGGSFAARHPDWVVKALGLLLVLMIVAGLAIRRREKHA